MTTRTAFDVLDGTIVPVKPLSARRGEVALVFVDRTDAGSQIVCGLVQGGYRVAVTGRDVTHLARILRGHRATQVLAVGADPADSTQVSKLVTKVERSFGRRIDLVVRAQDGAPPNQTGD